MANLDFNVLELTRQVFDLGAISIPVGSLPSSVEYDELDTFEYSNSYPKSALMNRPILDTVYFKEGERVIYHLTAAPVISVRRPKRIIKSTVRRRTGTVKEMISLGDYVGVIRGILTNADSLDPPYEAMAELAALNNKPKEWEVESDLFGHLDIFSIVITDIDFPASPGLGNSQPYVISFESDEPIILDI